MKNKFIVIEGIEGAGKSSIVKYIGNILRSYKINNLVFTREPGGTPLSEKLRILIKQFHHNEIIHNYTELLIFYAARTQLLENIIKPALNSGSWVISDRFDLSSQTYQGAGRCINKQLLHILRKNIIGNFKPGIIFYLDVSPEVGLKRISSRNNKLLDRIETESLNFFYRVRYEYLKLAKKNSSIITINANKPFEMVISEVRKYLIKWLRKNI